LKTKVFKIDAAAASPMRERVIFHWLRHLGRTRLRTTLLHAQRFFGQTIAIWGINHTPSSPCTNPDPPLIPLDVGAGVFTAICTDTDSQKLSFLSFLRKQKSPVRGLGVLLGGSLCALHHRPHGRGLYDGDNDGKTSHTNEINQGALICQTVGLEK
jgi:hypothetical protein